MFEKQKSIDEGMRLHAIFKGRPEGVPHNAKTRGEFLRSVVAQRLDVAFEGMEFSRDDVERLRRGLCSLCEPVVATGDPVDAESAGHALRAVMILASPMVSEGLGKLLEYCQVKTLEGRKAFLDKHRPGDLARDAADKAAEVIAKPFRIAGATLDFISANTGAGSKSAIGAAAASTAILCVLTGVGLSPFLHSHAFEVGKTAVKAYVSISSVYAAIREAWSLPTSLVQIEDKAKKSKQPISVDIDRVAAEKLVAFKDELAIREPFPADWKAQLDNEKLKLQRESIQRTRLIITRGLSDSSMPIRERLAMRLELKDQDYESLAMLADARLQVESDPSKPFSPGRQLRKAIDAMASSDERFRALANSGFTGRKALVSIVAAAFPQIVPHALGIETPGIEAASDIAFFALAGHVKRKIDERRAGSMPAAQPGRQPGSP